MVFYDSATGQYWVLPEDTRVVVSGNGREFFDSLGGKIQDIPMTLEPVEKLPEIKPPVPQSVSRFQGREAMWRTAHGSITLFEAAEAVINNPETPVVYRRAWEDMQEFRRDSEMLIIIAGQLGLTNEQIDDLFILADTIIA